MKTNIATLRLDGPRVLFEAQEDEAIPDESQCELLCKLYTLNIAGVEVSAIYLFLWVHIGGTHKYHSAWLDPAGPDDREILSRLAADQELILEVRFKSAAGKPTGNLRPFNRVQRVAKEWAAKNPAEPAWGRQHSAAFRAFVENRYDTAVEMHKSLRQPAIENPPTATPSTAKTTP